ncbi:hypothetical protein DYY66_0863 [Candidatus Nitrosotalea sp. FS]|nr:hypothetical protein [Candidatus Nitrosotalea sp. FS]
MGGDAWSIRRGTEQLSVQSFGRRSWGGIWVDGAGGRKGGCEASVRVHGDGAGIVGGSVGREAGDGVEQAERAACRGERAVVVRVERDEEGVRERAVRA